MTQPARLGEVRELYVAGVDAVQDMSSRLTGEQWGLPACGSWTATSTARHLLAVARWYHHWLDRALNGTTSRPFPGSDIAAHNETALAEHANLSGVEAIDAFAGSALDYLDRAADAWETPFSYPFGTVTVGLHCGIAATEWHIHAWDLSTLTTTPHVPQDPHELFVAAGRCVAVAEGGIKGAAIGWLVPLGARRNPWKTLLERSGRTPAD